MLCTFFSLSLPLDPLPSGGLLKGIVNLAVIQDSPKMSTSETKQATKHHRRKKRKSVASVSSPLGIAGIDANFVQLTNRASAIRLGQILFIKLESFNLFYCFEKWPYLDSFDWYENVWVCAAFRVFRTFRFVSSFRQQRTREKRAKICLVMIPWPFKLFIWREENETRFSIRAATQKSAAKREAEAVEEVTARETAKRSASVFDEPVFFKRFHVMPHFLFSPSSCCSSLFVRDVL